MSVYYMDGKQNKTFLAFWFCFLIGIHLKYRKEKKKKKISVCVDIILACACASHLYNAEKQKHQMLLYSGVSHVSR